jgi:AraC family transcriptional regulator
MVLEPRIEYMQPFGVVGVEGTFIGSQSPDATNDHAIPRLWREFNLRSGEVRHRTEAGVTYGVMYWRPESERSHPDELQYIAGARVGSQDEVPPGMTYLEVPAATYAIFTHRGPLGNLTETIRYIDEEWAPASEYKHSGIEIERYDSHNSQNSDDSVMEYSVSVVRKTH